LASILSLDLGTTALKLLVLSDAGKVLYRQSVPYPTRFPEAGGIEQDPAEWEKALAAGLAAMSSAIPPESIDLVSFSGHMSSVVLVDSKGDAVYPCVTLADSRSEEQTSRLRGALSGEILRSTGNPVLNAFALPKLLWLMEERPEAFRRAARWISAKDYLRLKLTGEIFQDTTDAYNSLCLDRRSLGWNQGLIRDAGLPPSLFPDVLAPHHRAGSVSAEAARRFGLRQGTMAFAGGADMACGVVSMGLRRPGDAAISLGTNAPFLMIVKDVETAHSGALTYHVGAQGGSVYALGSHFNGGMVVNSFARLFSEDGEIDYDLIQALSRQAEALPPGADGLVTLPFLVGSGSPYFSPSDRGTVIGIGAATTRAHLLLSALEGIALNLRQSYERFRSMSGGRRLNVSLYGGGVRIALWPRLFADVFASPVQVVQNSDASAVGAALLGGQGAGIFEDPLRTAESMLSITRTVDFDPERAAAYDRLYERYLALYQAMQPLYKGN